MEFVAAVSVRANFGEVPAIWKFQLGVVVPTPMLPLDRTVKVEVACHELPWYERVWPAVPPGMPVTFMRVEVLDQVGVPLLE